MVALGQKSRYFIDLNGPNDGPHEKEFLSIFKFRRNLRLVKQFTYMHLKGLVTHFKVMLLLIMLWLTVSEILGLEVDKFC